MEKLIVQLTASDTAYLSNYIRKGKHSARAIKRATVLLHLADQRTIKEASVLAGVSEATVSNIKVRYKAEKGDVAKAIEDRPRPGQAPKITPQLEAHITALACSTAPDGRSHWSLRLLSEKVVELGYVDSLSHEAIRKCLKKVCLSRGRKDNGASAR